MGVLHRAPQLEAVEAIYHIVRTWKFSTPYLLCIVWNVLTQLGTIQLQTFSFQITILVRISNARQRKALQYQSEIEIALDTNYLKYIGFLLKRKWLT